MKEYIVRRKELWEQTVIIKASSSEEAVEKAFKGEGDFVADPQFHDFLPSCLWTVEEAD